MEGRTIAHIDSTWQNHELQVGKCVPTVVPGVVVETSLRSDADAASGDRTPTASGDREQDFPDWLKPFTEGLVEEG